MNLSVEIEFLCQSLREFCPLTPDEWYSSVLDHSTTQTVMEPKKTENQS